MARTDPITTTVGTAIDDAVTIIEELRSELQDWLDGMPENLQASSKAEELQESIDGLSEFVDNFDTTPEIVADLECSYAFKKLRNPPRRVRRDEASALLAAALGAVEAYFVSDVEHEENFATISAFQAELEGWASSVDDVNFPGLR